MLVPPSECLLLVCTVCDAAMQYLCFLFWDTEQAGWIASSPFAGLMFALDFISSEAACAKLGGL